MAQRIDLDELETLANQSPTKYPETVSLTALEAVFLLSALPYLAQRWLWLDAGSTISDARWDTAESLVSDIQGKILG